MTPYPIGLATRHLSNINKNDLWETPPDELKYMCDALGFQPQLDVCATISNTKCKKFYTEKDNALTQSWAVDWFCNPPYSKVNQFVRYGLGQCRQHQVNGMMLTFAKTDTKWFHELLALRGIMLLFHKGRIKFLLNGIPKGSAPYPSVWIMIKGDELT